MDHRDRLPIKVVIPQPKDRYVPPGGGGGRKIFGDPEQAKEQLVEQLAGVMSYFDRSFGEQPDLPAVARVTLKREALAKSHRPYGLLENAECPVIGTRGFGEVLVSVRSNSIRRLQTRIRSAVTKESLADISTIAGILPYSLDVVTEGIDPAELRRTAREARGRLRVQLFHHRDPQANELIRRRFYTLLHALNVPLPDELVYAPALEIFRVVLPEAELAERVASFVGVQSVTKFPRYRFGSIRTTALPVRDVHESDFPPPEADVDYPLVGIIDSGINPDDARLAPWVAARVTNENVPDDFRDYTHGSFVAALAVNAHLLNQSDPTFPKCSVKLVDALAVAADKDIGEDELLEAIDAALVAHPEVKYWNLSLGDSRPCGDLFSKLAMALDFRQDAFNTTFVIAAGNYDEEPMRGWPPGDDELADGVAAPGDSIRGVTVGSVAHICKKTSLVKVLEPSPFSRRGPGPAHTPKPELVHCGGNCDRRGRFSQTGVLSLDGTGKLAEDVGTSFSTPIVTSLLANVDHALTAPHSRALVKALAIHAATLRGQRLTTAEMHYHGFGIPPEVPEIISCSPAIATLIFEPELVPGVEFEKRPFPVPDCLIGNDGLVRGDIVMTLVYEPRLDSTSRAEYCRTNVDASLGTYTLQTDGKYRHKKEVPAEPTDVGEMYEEALVEHGFKWSPVKVYRRSLSRGIAGDSWRLAVRALSRDPGIQTPVRASLIISWIDPKGTRPVYDDVINAMVRLGWATQNLEVRSQFRISP
jgi:serine protease AprX